MNESSHCHNGPVRVGIVLDIDDRPTVLHIWATLCAAELTHQLWEHGIVATVVRIDIDGHSHTTT